MSLVSFHSGWAVLLHNTVVQITLFCCLKRLNNTKYWKQTFFLLGYDTTKRNKKTLGLQDKYLKLLLTKYENNKNNLQHSMN